MKYQTATASEKGEKVILITGAMSDIGREICKTFAAAGYRIVINYRSHPELVEAFTDTLKQEYGQVKVLAIQANIRYHTEVITLFDQTYNAFGILDVLVNNAGINRDNSVINMSDEEWETVISTILSGTFYCSQEFARRYEGAEGNIINIGSTSAMSGRKNGANYCSARAGVLALTKCLALELAPDIRVNAIIPGCIDTLELRTRYQLDNKENLETMERRIPLGQLGQPNEIANMALYIATPGRYITGQNFFVDGGLLMR